MQTVQSIDRAFQILEEVASDPGGISDLSRRLDLPTSTVARLLTTLERLGAVERLVDDNGYRIGSAIVTMAGSIDPNQSLFAVAQSHMVDLVEQVAEAVVSELAFAVCPGFFFLLLWLPLILWLLYRPVAMATKKASLRWPSIDPPPTIH